MKIEDLFNCNNVKCMKTGEFCIEVDNVRIVYSINYNLSIITEILLKSTNFKSVCRILFDTRKGKIIDISCSGFKSDKVKLALEACFKERNLLYNPI
ncbi:hypothetical protein DFR86_03880 [Acidianus sulfidivorans JP7]|uniref:Uncharacterized protein n=1 Tax=Acidianus sulfidivorans JP7 TaxID=619593 RepID=A0A2U9IL62_9CREN|nr:hypothetical protein [Acidianus sulfidivorans]AWR96779.1 hypothetical protein DFR86_03880 [Acidianus sulfidivorans JP7]